MTVLSWALTVLDVALVLAFVVYLLSLRRLPTARRTHVEVYDRLGHPQEPVKVEPPARS